MSRQITVTAWHPYPSFEWQFRRLGSEWAAATGDIFEPGDSYLTNTLLVNDGVVEGEQCEVRCVITGPDGQEKITRIVTISVGALEWTQDLLPADPSTIEATDPVELLSLIVTDEATTEGRPVTFKAVPYNGPNPTDIPFTYTWTYPHSAFTGQGTDTITITSPTVATDNGKSVLCTVQQELAVSEATATVTVMADVASDSISVKNAIPPVSGEFYHSFATSASVGNFTYSRAVAALASSSATCQTSASTLAVLAEGEAGFVNGSRLGEGSWTGPCTGIQLEAALTQDIGHSNDMDGWKWSVGGGGTKVETAADVSPAGTQAWLHGEGAGGGWVYQQVAAGLDGEVGSIWCRTQTGSGTVNLIAYGLSDVNTLFSVTETWQRIDYHRNNANLFSFDPRHNSADLASLIVYGAQAELGMKFPTSTAVSTGSTGGETRAVGHCSGTLQALDPTNLPLTLSNDFILHLTYVAMATAAELPASGMIPMCLQDATPSGSIYFHHAATTGLITVYIDGTPYAATAVTPNRGDTIDLRLRKSLAEGLSIWVDGVKTVHIGATAGLNTPADTLLINEGGESDGNYMVGWGHYAMVRVIPEAMTDDYVENLTDQPA